MTSRSNHLQNGLKARLDKRYLKDRTAGTDCHLVPHPPFGAHRVPLDGALAHGHRRLRAGQQPARESRTVGNGPPHCAGIRERRYQKPGHCARELPTLPASGEKKPFLPPSARDRASVGTDGRRFWRSPVPALPTVPVSRAAVPRVPDVTHGTC